MNDINIQARRCFIRISIKEFQSINKVLDFIRHHDNVDELVYYSVKTKDLYNDDEDDSNIFRRCNDTHEEVCNKRVFPYPNAYTLQILIQFNKTVYISNFAIQLYNAFTDHLLFSITDVDFDEKSIMMMPVNNHELCTYYDACILAGNLNSQVSKIHLDDIVIYKKNTTFWRNGLCWSCFEPCGKFFKSCKWNIYHTNLNCHEMHYAVLLPYGLYDVSYNEHHHGQGACCCGV